MRSLMVFVLATVFTTVASAQQAFILDLGNNKYIGVVMLADGTTHAITNVTIIKIEQPTNPYQAPTQELRTALEPLTKFNLSPQDSKAIAKVYTAAAAGVQSGQLSRTDGLKQFLIEQGQPLGLTGKYEGLAEVGNKLMGELLTDDIRDTTPEDAKILSAFAWAFWETGN